MAAHAAAPVPPDIATCDACLRELRDPADRRHRYPFINCADCGPRFTIVRGVPYDRALTTMAQFAMCAACAAEYADPSGRRFQAHPNACPECGPRLSHALDEVVGLLRGGGIVAVKGIGGFHLACVASDEQAVARLRSRRDERPFAVMASGLEAARELVDLGPVESALLAGRDRPIVLARRRHDAPIAPAVAPHAAELGVMLPFSPLDHLLLDDVGEPLVMTGDDEGAADLVLTHDLPIQARVDDSVLRVAGGRPLPLRRSRGAVPSVLALPVAAVRHVLACGAERRSTFCLARGRRAWVSQHIGDLKAAETLASFQDGVRHFERLFAVTPEVVAHDSHPDYISTAYALAREGVERVAVEHHHAHLAACLAEHGEQGPAVAAIFDGTGGEILVGDLRGFERAGHLWPVPLPGGDQAVREPWRMACAWLKAAGDERPLTGIDPDRWRAAGRLAESGLTTPVTTSVGRLFDAVSALSGLRTEVTYDGQAAIELEAACDPSERGAYAFDVVAGVLDARPAILDARRDVTRGLDVGVVATRFHHALADATAEDCARLAGDRGLATVVLSGGVFQNRRLLERTAERLAGAGLRVLVPALLPPNDGGLAFGQAAVAAATLAG
jgi:hydrogenase maturation protein HypF